MDEVFVSIKNYEGLYEVSNKGHVRSLRRQRLLTLRNKCGYYKVTLTKNGKAKDFLVHRLVAEAFIENPENLPIINHKDENGHNNCTENLEWCTQKYNTNYGTCIERRALLCNKKVLCIEMNKIYDSINDAAKDMNIAMSNISKCLHNRRKTAGSYHWSLIKTLV